MKLETVITKTLKITLEKPANKWFKNFAWGDDKYDYEELPDVMSIDKWKHFVRYLKRYLLKWPKEDIDFWNDEFKEYSIDVFENQIQEIIDVDTEGYDMVMI